MGAGGSGSSLKRGNFEIFTKISKIYMQVHAFQTMLMATKSYTYPTCFQCRAVQIYRGRIHILRVRLGTGMTLRVRAQWVYPHFTRTYNQLLTAH